ncbi:MAG TPA: DNA polymerase Y family protein [Acidobacteriota bacterium]|nr:DNA polymerase Y family protein [Acidobacteriota bacterium]
MAMVAEDRPQGLILWVNERAYQARVLPGLRYAAGLSICRELCAGEVPQEEIDAGVERLIELLRTFSPGVEPSEDEPGIFWIDAAGLLGLENSLESWAKRIRRTLREHHFVAHVAVGFSRFGVYTLARCARGSVVFETPEHENRAMRNVRLDRLHLDAQLRDNLAKLGIHTVGGFLDLPVDGLARRFGTGALHLHRIASGSLATPLDPVPHDKSIDAWIELESPEIDAQRLTFIIKRVLPALLQRAAAYGHGLSALHINLLLDDTSHDEVAVRTAETTLDAAQILKLVRLKLDTLELSAGAVEIRLTVDSTPTGKEQLGLFSEMPQRDLSAANRAFARLRAEFGRLSVVWPRLHHAHLPEATFNWEPLDNARIPAPRQARQRPLMRRIFDRPLPLPHRGSHEPDGWLVRGPEQGPMRKIFGPYTVSGGWWVREVHRDYHFVETQKGDVMWVFYDRNRRRWFLQGQVE